MKLKELFRATFADVSNVDEENRTVDLTFSSETPVDQYFGREILSHDPGAVDMSRLKNGAPLLWNHNRNDVRGVVEKAYIGNDKRGHATVRFSKSAKGEEAFQDVKDRIVRGVSVGYRVKDMAQSGGDKQNPEFTVKKWMPHEISLAPIPADHTVGIGRAADGEEQDVNVEFIQPEPVTRKEPTMTEKVAATAVEIDVARNEAVVAERLRINTIRAMGDKFKRDDLASKMIQEGVTLDAAREQFLDAIGAKQVPAAKITDAAGFVDASARELKNYSVCRAILAANRNDWSGAGFELECHKEILKRSGREGSDGFLMPVNIPMNGQRTTSATAYGATINAGQGGASLIQTDLLAGSFIDVLRNKARVMSLGAKMLSGLVGNIAIPRQDGQTPTYWVNSEGADVTEGETVFDQITMTPKTLGSRSQYTRQLLMQSTPDIEMLVRNDLAQVMALAIDLAAIAGTGAGGQPTGILNRSGIGSVALGTNGGALTFDALIALETALAVANADETNLAYLTNAKEVGNLKLLKDTTGRYLWTQYTANSMPAGGAPGEVNGYPVARSNQVPSNLTKGTGTNLSAVIFGNWSDLIIGEWGVLEILPNPYGAGFNSGSIDIRALQSVDVNVRHVASFAAVTDAI
ncbi:MAG: phage major capsid protein [Acidocella sp.]|nr:phage major capsid protein [Acidocella sp.]